MEDKKDLNYFWNDEVPRVLPKIKEKSHLITGEVKQVQNFFLQEGLKDKNDGRI